MSVSAPMPRQDDLKADRRSNRFLFIYALAWAGGSIAYIPFLTLLLPLHVSGLSGQEAIAALSYLTFIGAVSASLGGIAFGWLSDVTGVRKPWIVAGLGLSSIMLLAMPHIVSLLALALALIVWQAGLNMMLGPLSAMAADHVPDAQKGFLGGLLAFAPAAGAGAGALATIPGMLGTSGRFGLVTALTVACIVPLLLQPSPQRLAPASGKATSGPRTPRAIVPMWFARLAVQLSEAALFAYLLFYFASIDPAIGEAETARIFGLLLLVSIPCALAAGRWSDRTGKAIVPLRITAGLAALGLAIMAASSQVFWSLLGYVVFGLAASVFLSLHSSLALRVLPRRERRGRDLGLFNLTNTAPSLIVPWLTLAIVPQFGFAPLLWLLAAIAGAACLVLTRVRALPQTT